MHVHNFNGAKVNDFFLFPPAQPRSVRRVMNVPRRDPDFLLKIFVVILFIVIVTTILMVTRMYEAKQLMQQHESQIFFSDEMRQYHLLSTEGKIALKAHYGLGIPNDLTSELCLSSSTNDNTYGRRAGINSVAIGSIVHTWT